LHFEQPNPDLIAAGGIIFKLFVFFNFSKYSNLFNTYGEILLLFILYATELLFLRNEEGGSKEEGDAGGEKDEEKV
jgi:hypothetical protein